MKTIHIFKAVAILFFTFAALSCNDLFNWGTRDYSTQLEIGVAKGGSVLKAAADEPYYLDNCELATADAVKISISLQGGDPVVGMQDKVLMLYPVGDGVASDLISLLPGDYVVTKFEVLQWNETDQMYETIMATPVENSPFADYVSTKLGYEFSVELYKKNRLLMEVLCFELPEAPNFGFTWTDYNVVLGDELCMYISQCNEPVTYKASFYTVLETGEEGSLYASVSDLYTGGMCFPLWSGAKTYGVYVHIFDSEQNLLDEFKITAEDVNQFLDEQGYYLYEIPCPPAP
jgi:hypothetical protein